MSSKPSLPINRKRKISTDSSYSSESTDLSDSEIGRNATRADGLAPNASTQPATHQGIAAQKRRFEVSSTDFDPIHSVIPLVEQRPDVHVLSSDYQPEPSQPNTSGSTTTVNDREGRRKQAAIARIENQLDRKFGQIFTPWAGDDQDVSRNTLQTILKIIGLMRDSAPQNITQTLNQALNGGNGKREVAGGRKPIQSPFKELEATLQASKVTSRKGGTTDERSSSSANPQLLNHMNFQRTESGISKSPSLNRQLDPNQDLVMSSPTSLSQHKQSHTILIVRVAPFVKYQPMTLSECMSLQSFYIEVLGAWSIRGESVAEIVVTFTWKDPEDPMRMMVMNSRREACFAHLVQQVDKAPGWEESDKEHILDVEIVLKE